MRVFVMQVCRIEQSYQHVYVRQGRYSRIVAQFVHDAQIRSRSGSSLFENRHPVSYLRRHQQLPCKPGDDLAYRSALLSSYLPDGSKQIVVNLEGRPHQIQRSTSCIMVHDA